MPRTSQLHPKLGFEHALSSPRGGPRGLLLWYILHRIGEKPCHGYEILQSIESKTEGAWSPGAGSIYPILKTLVSKGLIKAEQAEAGETRRVYHLTPKGSEHLKEGKRMFANFAQRFSQMRGLVADLIEPEYIETIFVEGSKKQLEAAREIFSSKSGHLPASQVEYVLREYALNLERQLDWANQTLKELKAGQVVAKVRTQGGRS